MKILIAVESEFFADEQVDFITKHQWDKDLTFKIVHVVEPAPFEADEIDSKDFIIELAQLKRERGQKLVKSVAQKIGLTFKDARIFESVEIGHPKEFLLEEIENWEADVVIVGSHGRRELERATIGSVSSAVLSYAKCTVIVVRPFREYKPDA